MENLASGSTPNALDYNSLQEFNAMRHLDNPRQNNYNLVPQKPPLKHEADIDSNKGWL